MKAAEFCYWLQGYFEIHGEGAAFDARQADVVKRHLALVFKHEIDPSYSKDPAVQAEMQEIHDGKKKPRPPRPNGDGGCSHDVVYRC